MLLALAVQLGLGSSVPRLDPLAQLAGMVVLCHPAEPGRPAHAPAHLPDCLTCPLCAAVHAPPPTLIAGTIVLPPPQVPATAHAVLPPPSRAPPLRLRSRSQPRAPPFVS